MAQLVNKRTLGDTTEQAPGLASHLGRLFLTWKGAGNDNLNILFSSDDGNSFGGTVTYGDASDQGPALAASEQDGLWLAWKGSGNDNLNIARVELGGDTAGGFWIEPDLVDKVVLNELSSAGPAFAYHDTERCLGWKGSGNDNLNMMRAGANGPAGGPKITYGDASDRAPALADHNGVLFMAWKGSGNENVNVARAPVSTTGMGTDLTDKVTLGDTTEQGPALASNGTVLCLAWKGAGNDNLNVLFSADGRSWGGKTTFGDASDRQPALARHGNRLLLAWKGSGNENLNVAEVVP
jgi:hypothetical protein